MQIYTITVYSSKDFNKKEEKKPQYDMRVRSFRTLQQAQESIANLQCYKKQIVQSAIEMRKEVDRLQKIINALNNTL